MSVDPHDLVDRAAGPPAGPPDVRAVRRRVAQRRRNRQIAAAVTAVATIGGTGLLAAELVPPTPTAVNIAADPGAGQRYEPTWLPEATMLCRPPRNDDGLLITQYCTEDATLTLLRGPHERLRERGHRIAVAHLTGWFQADEHRVVVTVSDRDSMDDIHYQLTSDAPTHAPETLARILASIPALSEPT